MLRRVWCLTTNKLTKYYTGLCKKKSSKLIQMKSLKQVMSSGGGNIGAGVEKVSQTLKSSSSKPRQQQQQSEGRKKNRDMQNERLRRSWLFLGINERNVWYVCKSVWFLCRIAFTFSYPFFTWSQSHYILTSMLMAQRLPILYVIKEWIVMNCFSRRFIITLNTQEKGPTEEQLKQNLYTHAWKITRGSGFAEPAEIEDGASERKRKKKTPRKKVNISTRFKSAATIYLCRTPRSRRNDALQAERASKKSQTRCTPSKIVAVMLPGKPGRGWSPRTCVCVPLLDPSRLLLCIFSTSQCKPPWPENRWPIFFYCRLTFTYLLWGS